MSRRQRLVSVLSRRVGLSFQYAFVLLVSAACGHPQEADQARVVQSADRYRKEYVFAPGDQIEVFVRRVPEVSRTVVVRPDGYITLPIVDTVQAAGLAATELQAALHNALERRLVNPEVNVIALSVRPSMVYVAGEVNNTAAIPFRNAANAMEALAAAGGVRRSGSLKNVALIRLGKDGHLRAIPIAREGKGQVAPYVALETTPLQPDDVLFVPETGRSQFARFLDDFVNRPLQGINAGIATYVNYKLVRILNQ